MVRRFAEGTTVTVQASRSEIQSILAKHGCLSMAWAGSPTGDRLEFILDGNHFRFAITKPTLADLQAIYRADGKALHLVRDWQPKIEAEWRRRWRAHVLLLKAKLEFIEGGDTTLEREFLPYAVLPDGRTVSELIEVGGLKLLASGSQL